MSVKRKVLRVVISTAAALLMLYFGICAAATFNKAATQPHLESGTLHIGFIGFYMMAAADAAVSLLSAILLAVIIIKSIRKK